MKWLLILIIFGIPVVAERYESIDTCQSAGAIYKRNVVYNMPTQEYPRVGFICGPVAMPKTRLSHDGRQSGYQSGYTKTDGSFHTLINTEVVTAPRSAYYVTIDRRYLEKEKLVEKMNFMILWKLEKLKRQIQHEKPIR